MLPLILLHAGSAIIALWGIAHIAPARGVVKGFGDISQDNRRIILMEWVAEGMSLIFIGVLVVTVTLVAGPANPVSRAVYIACAAFLVIGAVWHLFTGARTAVVPMKMCPAVMGLVAVFFAVGAMRSDDEEVAANSLSPDGRHRALLVCGGSRVDVNVEDIRTAIIAYDPTAFYVGIMGDSPITLAPTSAPEGIRRHLMYLACPYHVESPGWIPVAVSRDDMTVIPLSGNPRGYSELLRKEGVRVESVDEAEEWIRFGLEVTRNDFQFFAVVEEVLDIPYNETTPAAAVAENLRRVERHLQPLDVRRSADGAFVGVVHVLVGYDMHKRTVRISRDGEFAFEDAMVARGVGKVLW